MGAVIVQLVTRLGLTFVILDATMDRLASLIRPRADWEGPYIPVTPCDRGPLHTGAESTKLRQSSDHFGAIMYSLNTGQLGSILR